jgi:hypothetical protein
VGFKRGVRKRHLLASKTCSQEPRYEHYLSAAQAKLGGKCVVVSRFCYGTHKDQSAWLWVSLPMKILTFRCVVVL